MRILHIASAFAVDYPGGITNYVRTLAASQVEGGDEVYVLDGSEERTWRRHQQGFRVQGTETTAARPFVASMPADPRGSAELLRFVRSEQWDIVHFHLTIGVGTDFYPLFAQAGIKYVISLHDYYLFCPRITMIDFTGKDCGGPARRKCERCVGKLDQIDVLYRASRKSAVRLPRVPSTRVTERRAAVRPFFRNAVAVIAVSQRVRAVYETVYPDARYVVAHIGTSSAAVRRPQKVASDRLRLTFLGVLDEYKGAGVLEAIGLGLTRKDVEIKFFGRVHRRTWAARVQRAGVEICGPYTEADLPTIMSNTDVGLVLPVWEDSAPQVAMEFLNYGVPVLASRIGGLPDFVSSDNGFLFDPKTRLGIQSAIAYIEGINAGQARMLGASMPRLVTPEMHAAYVRRLYAGAATSPSGHGSR